MYAMKSFHSSTTQESGGLGELRQRQENLLNSLHSIEAEMKAIAERLGCPLDGSVVKTVKKTGKADVKQQVQTKRNTKVELPKLPEGRMDYIISTSVEKFSLAPLLIAELLKRRGLNVRVPMHVHSSFVNELPENLKSLFQKMKPDKREKVLFTYIFKDEPLLPSLMFEPVQQSCIRGESTICRYLARTFAPDLYDSSDIMQSTMVDRWLDLLNQASESGDHSALLKLANAELGKQRYLAGDQISLADIVLTSAFMCNPPSSLPKNVNKWMDGMKEEFSAILGDFSAGTGISSKISHQRKIALPKLPDGRLDYVISTSVDNFSWTPLFIAELMRKRGLDISIPMPLPSKNLSLRT
jgi:hypothetical protein